MRRNVEEIREAVAVPNNRWSRAPKRIRIASCFAVLAMALMTVTPVSAQSATVPNRPERPVVDSVDHAAVTTSWADPGDASITGYQILRRDRSAVPAESFVVIVDDTGSSATSFTDDTVQASRSYAYRVKAHNAHGLSRRSRSARVTTPSAPVEPIVEDVEVPEPGTSTTPVSDSDDFADSIETTGTVAVDGSVTGHLESAGDNDWFAVTLVAGVDYQIDVEGQPTGSGTLTDPYLRGIHDANGTLISGSTDDDGGTGRNSRLIYEAATSGVHYLAAGAWGTRTGTYTLSVTDLQQGDDFAASASTTGTVAVGGSVTGDIEVGGDLDWIAVTLVAGSTYQIDLMGEATGDGTLPDPWLRGVYNSYGQKYWDTDDDDGGVGWNSRLVFVAGNTGVQYIEAGAVGSDIGTYTLSVSLTTSQQTCNNGHCS